MTQDAIVPPDDKAEIVDIARKMVELATMKFEYRLKGFEKGPIVFEKLTEIDREAFNDLSVRHFDTAVGMHCLTESTKSSMLF